MVWLDVDGYRQLLVKWVVKRWERVSKQSIKYGGREVNHSRVGPLRVVGKALQKTSDVQRATWVMYTLRCSSGSVSPT